MKSWVYIFLVFLLLLLSSGCSDEINPTLAPDASSDAVPELAGDYLVVGIDPLGTEYGGLLSIRGGENPGSFSLQWLISGSIQRGTGLLQGNQLLVSWYSIEEFGGGVSGTTTYTITMKGELYGIRTVDGHTGEGTEYAFPNEPE
jgi:hypothetical protein